MWRLLSRLSAFTRCRAQSTLPPSLPPPLPPCFPHHQRYYGGKGLPFFWTTLDGAVSANGEIAKQAFSIHKTMGTYGKYLIPLHVGAAGAHAVRGQAIFARINPFR